MLLDDNWGAGGATDPQAAAEPELVPPDTADLVEEAILPLLLFKDRTLLDIEIN
jgi:hypothetical protein